MAHAAAGRIRGGRGLLVAAFVALIAVPAQGQATPSSDPEADRGPLTPQQELTRNTPNDDIRQYAEDFDLTTEEAANRLALQRSGMTDQVDQALRDLSPEHFAGTWFDHQTSDVVLAVTQIDETVVEALQVQFSDLSFDVRDVQFTSWDLESTYFALTGLKFDPAFQETYPPDFSIVMDPMSNSVIVGAQSEAERAPLRAAIQEFIETNSVDLDTTLERLSQQRGRDNGVADGTVDVADLHLQSPPTQQQDPVLLDIQPDALDEIVDVRNLGVAEDDSNQSTCSSRSHCYGLRGGLYPYYVYRTDGRYTCSSGFSVTQGSARGTTTSGHCAISPYNHVVRHGGTDAGHTIGRVSGRIDSGPTDALWIQITAPVYQQATVYVNDSLKSAKVTGLRAYSGLDIEEYICAYFGRTGRKDCGYIQTNRASHANNWNIIAISRDQINAQGGDSGSPFRFGYLAAAMHNGRDSTYLYASAMELVLDDLIVDLSTTS